MAPIKKISAGALFAGALLVGGCGGGGSDSSGQGSGTLPAANSWLQFTPAAIELNLVEGRQQDFTVVAKSSKTIPQAFNIGIVEKTGLIEPTISLSTNGPLEYKATMKVSTALKPGNYSSRLEVRLCEDSPLTCARPIEGSPWYVPINVTVKAATNLSALQDLPNVGAWHGIGGNAAHTGYIPGNFDPSKFSPRFAYNFPANSAEYIAGELAIENGVVYMNVDRRSLRALDEATGKFLWSVNLPSSFDTSGPNVANGKVYVGSAGFSSGGDLLVYDKANGALTGKIGVGDIDTRGGIEAHGGGMLFIDRAGVKRADLAAGSLQWKTSVGADPFRAPVADANNVYVFKDASLNILRASDGAAVSAPFSTSQACYSIQVHATDGKGMLYGVCQVGGGTTELRAIDTVQKRTTWSVTGKHSRGVALGGTTLYSLNGGTLEARGVADGKLLWSTPLTAGADAMPEADTVLVTDNLAFVASIGGARISGTAKTVAVDLTTHKVVWSYPLGGDMAISSKGILYLAGETRGNSMSKPATLAAINLR